MGLTGFLLSAGGRPWNPEKLVDADRDDAEAVVSPDGRYLVYHHGGSGPARDIWLLELTGARSARPLITAPDGVGTPAMNVELASPDQFRRRSSADTDVTWRMWRRCSPGG